MDSTVSIAPSNKDGTDVMAIFYSAPEEASIQTIVYNDVKCVSVWLALSKLTLSVSKTKCMFFRTPTMSRSPNLALR